MVPWWDMDAWAGLHDNVPRPTLRHGCTCLGANWPPWHLQLKLSLSQKVGCTAEVVTQSRASVHLGWVARDWRTFCHLGSQSAWTLSCNPALAGLDQGSIRFHTRSFAWPWFLVNCLSVDWQFQYLAWIYCKLCVCVDGQQHDQKACACLFFCTEILWLIYW